jgi:hypothetical protein
MRFVLFILLPLVFSSCSSATHRPRSQAEIDEYRKQYAHYYEAYHITPPLFFWNDAGATNGLAVVLAIRSPSPESRAKVRALVGSTVVLVGDCYQRRKGVLSDLETHRETEFQPHDITIEVDIVPFQDVHPRDCGSWMAEVRGTLESVDFEKRIIRITAKPKDWKILAKY